MRNKITLTLIIIGVFFSFNNFINAQAPFKYLTYIFPSDSLKGFDEEAAKQEALSRGFFGPEYHVMMYSQKRHFINNKYGYTFGSALANAKGSNPVINTAPCVNEDFESSPSTTSTSTVGTVGTSLAGWQVSWGQNQGINGSCLQTGCCPLPGSTDCWVRSTPWTAPAPLGVIPTSPFGGTKVLQMNDNITAKGEVVRIQQTFPVTSSNALFQFAYKAAMDGSGHACCDQPYIRVELLDCMNNILACPQVSITPPGPSCATVSATGWTTSGNISYTPNWIIKAIDLSPYLGSCVTIKITVGDCDGWAHYGYAFFDCQCLPMTVTVNNIQFPAGNAVVGVAACGVTTGTMVAPPGLGPYVWNGPAGSGITANPNQTVTTTMPGNYTLTMTPPGICTPITKTVSLQFGSFPVAGLTVGNTCTTYTITNTGTAAPSVQSYSFTGPGAPSSFTTTSPTSVINFAPSTTYTIYQTVTNPQNCPSTASLVITTPPGPSPAFTASPSFTQCIGNAFTFNATTAVGSHTYVFSPAAGAPATGFTANYGPVSFTSPGTYTVIHTVNSAGCVSSTQSVVVVNSIPTASATAIPPPCSGGTATLTGTGGPGSISWAGPSGWTGVGGNASITSFSAPNVGTYTMTVNNFGCITTKTVSITLPPQPSVTVTNTGPYCVGQTIQMTATPSTTAGIQWSYWYNGTWTWYNFSTTLTPTITNAQPTSSGVYWFYASFSGGCAVTGSTQVTVISSPTVSATNTGPYCAGATIQLNSPTAAGSYSWSGPASFTATGQNPTRPASTPTMSGNYTVMIGSGSCTAAATTSVTVYPLPTPTVGSNSPVCLGGTLNLTALGGTTYTWSGPGGYTSTTQNPSITSITAAQAGVYTVTVTGPGGCKNTATVNVTVTTPTTTATNTGPYCAGATITLNTPAATSYTWTGPSAFTSNAQNPTIASATAIMSGVYTVTSTTGGCKAVATTSVTVNALPTPAATNTGPYCPGNTIQLNVGAFTTYTWTGPSAFASNLQNPTQASAVVSNGGVYTVTVTNANGCVNTSSTTVVVNPTPVPVVGSNSPICLNSTINLTATGGTGYAWSGPNAFASALQNPTIASATSVNAGVYTVTVTALGCTNTGTVSVTVLTPTTTATNPGPFCVGTTIQLNTPAATSYTWSGPGGFTSNLQNPTIASAALTMAGTYSVLVSAGTCTANATTAVVVNALPTPAATNTGPYCPGNTIQLNVGAYTTYTWTGPSAFASNSQNPTQASAVVSNGGVYTVTVTNANGCVNTSSTTVVVNPTPVPVVGSNSPICLNSAINLTATGGTGYAWSGPNAFASALQNPTVASATSVNAGVYTVTVTALGCTNTGTVNVTILTPTTTATNAGPFCVGTTIQLNTPAATSYTWSGPGGFTSNLQNPTIASAALTMAGTYSVLVSAGTCTANATTAVVVNALPTPAATNTGPYCPGNTIQLNVGAFTTYTWTGPSAFASNLQNPTQASAVVSNGGVYTVTVTDANGCVNTSSTTVVVNPTPAPIVGSNSPVCLSTAINLTATGGTGYAWSGPNAFSSALQNPTIASATAADAGVYTVTVTALGCTNTGTVNVTVLSPTTSASNTGAYCAGTTIQLNTPAATTYNWSGPLGFTSALQNPTIPASTAGMTGVYNVTVSVGTCTAAATTSVTVNALPTPAATNTGAYCFGNTIQLNVGAYTTYTWTGPGSFNSTSQNPTIPSAAVTNSGLYSVSVTDANGCTNSSNTNVVVNVLPTIVLNSPTTCENTTIGLTATGGTAFAWSGPGGFTSASQNPNIPSATTAMTGVYTVTVTDVNGCVNTAVTNASVIALPIPNAATGGAVCVGATLNLNSAGGTSYSWTGPNGFTSNLQNPNIPAASLNAGGIYTVIVTANTCTAVTTVSATINALPSPNIVTNSPICVGQGLNLTGSGGTSYSWSGPSGFNSSNQNPTISSTSLSNGGNYILTVTDANGCVNSTNSNVTINPLPNASATGGSACENMNVSLGANGGATYAWTGPNAFSSNLQNPTITSAPFAASGQYTVVVTSAVGCVSTAFTSVVVNPIPVANITSNGPICVNTVLNLSATGGVTYAWSGPNGFTSSSQNPTFNANSTNYSGNYNLTVTDANGCSSSTVIPVVINGIPNASIVSSNNVGCAPLCVTFTVNSSATIANYNWNLGNGVTGNTASAETCYGTTGVYTISASVSDAIGCSSSVTYTVQVYPQPIADFNHAPIKPIINQDPFVTFTDASHGATITSWNWYFMNTAQYTSNVQNPTFMYTEPGTYAVALVVKSDMGCTDTIVRPLVVGEDFGIYVPNAFTPNEDGLNDIFQPKGFGIVKYELQIFDRWGEKVFQTKSFEEGWNGKYQGRGGEIVEEGSYTWLINATSVFGKAHELKGHVTLIK